MKTQATKTTTKTAKVTVTAPVTPAPKAKLEPIGTKAKAKKIAVAPATVTPITTPAPVAEVSKRITVGAKIDRWRCVPSQRKGKPGYFVQGGNYEMKVDGRNHFTVGCEQYFEDRADAQAALRAKQQAAA